MPARGISDIGSLRLPISNIGSLVEGMIGQNRSEGMWIRLQDSLTGFWSDVKTSMHNRLHRGQAVREFLHAVKEGDTTGVLLCLANHPFLLEFHTFASDGDTVWHLLAEFGDATLLNALTNFIKIHRGVKTSKTRQRGRDASNSGRHSSKAIAILNLVNLPNRLKQTPLMFAAYHGRDDVLVFLLKQGADPWAADRCGRRTALHYACMKGYAACVRAILDNLNPEDKERDGVKYVDVASASGFTPLHFAVGSNCIPVIRTLLSFEASIEAFNMFDAGEFWISCVTKSTALHVAAVSNRIGCARAILQHYAENKDILNLQDPRGWCDKKGRTPKDVAKMKNHEEMVAILDPSAEIQLFALGSTDNSLVPKLQVFAATVFQKQLLASIQEAEEFMKLLGTHQMHGRVFARLAYNSNEPTSTSGNENVYEAYANMPVVVRENLMKEHLAGKRVDASSRPLTSSAKSLGADAARTSFISSSAKGGVLASVSYMGKKSSSSSNLPAQSSMQQQQASTSYSSSKATTSTNTSSVQSDKTKKGATVLKKWLSHDPRKQLNDDGVSASNAHASEKSTLAHLRSEDDQGLFGSAFGCFHGSKTSYRAPTVGEDVCGLCHDNKPLLQMLRCEHRTCLLCAKSMTYLLDMQQLVLCPFCGEIVESFGLA